MTDIPSQKISAWEKFAPRHMDVMRVEGRTQHPTRPFVYEVIRQEFRSRHFRWLDAGIVGMVDYERLYDKLAFTFTGVDLSPSILEDSRRLLRRSEDRVLRWSVEEPIETAEGLISESFDLVTIRHVLNHCHYYEVPIRNFHQLLVEGGMFVITLHHWLRDHEDRFSAHSNWDMGGEVIKHLYNKEKFLSFLSQGFRVERFVRFDDRYKPNDVLVARKRPWGDPSDDLPAMEIVRSRRSARQVVGSLVPPQWKAPLKRMLRLK